MIWYSLSINYSLKQAPNQEENAARLPKAPGVHTPHTFPNLIFAMN
jgi:hypothetical protein